MDNKNEKLVVKHNKLIEFKGRMSLNELKLFSLIIADVREQQEKQFEEYYIDISVLKETTKDKNFYNYISSIAFKLEEKRILTEKINNNGMRERTSIRLINKPRIIENSHYLGIHLDKDLIPYIIDLKREFTRYQIENILRLKSSYAVRIYELLKQYENIGKRTFEIEELRSYLGIDKIEYKRFFDFEKRVLEISQQEINESTDLIISYTKNKKGRKIDSITFNIESKEDHSYIEFLNQTYNIKEFKEKSGLESENFNAKQTIELYEIAVDMMINDYKDENDLFEYIKLNYLLMNEKQGIKNKFSYLKKALKEDYAAARGQIKFNYPIN